MTERYTRNNWGKDKIGKTPAEQALSDRIVINDGTSKIVINKSGEFYKENRKNVKTSIFNRNHGVSVTILVLILITALLQVFYSLIASPFESANISADSLRVIEDIIFIIPFVVFVILTFYVVYAWIMENKTKKKFCKAYMEYLVDNYINKAGAKTKDRSIAESDIRKDMKNQINIYDNGLRNDGKHRMSKELSSVVSIMATVGFGLIIFNIVLPFWLSLLCQAILMSCGLIG